MLAKGNRSKAVTNACKKHGGFYLGSIGGPAAVLASNSIKKVEVLEYPELGTLQANAEMLCYSQSHSRLHTHPPIYLLSISIPPFCSVLLCIPCTLQLSW